jgi:hypothetical protein
MPSTPPSSGYPFHLFLHCQLSSPKALQAVLQSPNTPKLRKAHLISYTESSGRNKSAVSYDGQNFGEPTEEDLKGMVYMVANQQEEAILIENIGQNCTLQDVEIELLCWTGNTTVWSKVFARAPAAQIEDSANERDLFDNRFPAYARHDAWIVAYARHDARISDSNISARAHRHFHAAYRRGFPGEAQISVAALQTDPVALDEQR